MSTKSTSAKVSIPTWIGIAWDSGEIRPYVVNALVTRKEVVVGSAVGSWGNRASLKIRLKSQNHSEFVEFPNHSEFVAVPY